MEYLYNNFNLRNKKIVRKIVMKHKWLEVYMKTASKILKYFYSFKKILFFVYR